MTQQHIDSEWKFHLKKFTKTFFHEHQEEFLRDQLSIYKLVLLRNNKVWMEWEQEQLMKLLGTLLFSGELIESVREEILHSPEMKSYFITAFTHNSIDSISNYEAFEFLGDLTYNKCVGYYIVRRYPQLLSCEAADILTRLKIKIVKSKTMGALAREQGLIKFIQYNPYSFSFQKTSANKIGEDVLEALLGSIEFYMDNKFGLGTGYATCYRIVKKWLDQIAFDLSYDQLVDPYTILKEIHDKYRKELGTLKRHIVNIKQDTNGGGTVEVILTSYNEHTRTTTELGKIVAPLVGNADTPRSETDPTSDLEWIEELKQKVSKMAIDKLSQSGCIHPDRNKYQRYMI